MDDQVDVVSRVIAGAVDRVIDPAGVLIGVVFERSLVVDHVVADGQRFLVEVADRRLLKDPYYCGKFEYPKGSGSWYKVGHESIVDDKLFEEVQIRLAVAPRSKPGTKEFDFVRLMKCGACGSGVSAQEKFKKIKKDKSIRRYVYYHCTDGVSRKCRQPWIREENLIAQLSTLMGKIDLDKVKATEKFDNEIRRFQRFRQVILADKSESAPPPEIDFRKFAQYILQEGSKEERRELLGCLKGQILLKDLKVYL